MKGEAEAFATEAKGRAEAEQMNKKAEAFKQYKDGAMVDMLLEKLPLVSVTLIDYLMKYSVMIEPQATLVLCTALFFNQCFCCWHHSQRSAAVMFVIHVMPRFFLLIR